jgi:putative hydrolase
MLKTDLHTHSIASGHALNTVYEMVREAKEKGMGLIGIVEHGPSMEGAPHEGYFWVSDQLDELYGVRVLLGIEANILNEGGEIDLNGELLAKQRVVIAGLHARTPYKTNNLESNTLALVAAMQNPLVQIISHPYRMDFPVDIERVFQEAYKTQTLLELNNQVFTQQSSQDGFLETYKRLVDLSKRYGHPLIAGSDAHVAKKIGADSGIVTVYKQIGLTDDLLINNKPEELIKWKKKR